jgi:hypothetical protein
MSFWETHRGALSVMGVFLFLLLAAYLAAIRPALRESEEARATIAQVGTELIKFYPTLGSEDVATAWQPLSAVRAECQKQQEGYKKQIEDLKTRLRFPFDEFTYPVVPADEKYPGMWLSKRYSLVQQDVESRCIQANVRGLPAQLAPSWLGFTPSATPDKVSKDQAQEELKKLCLAERVTVLAIDSGVSRVLRVEPQNRAEEGATYQVPNPKPGPGQPSKLTKEYDNRFIVNYPVSITMIGSLDSAMRFVHKVQQKLVIRYFRIVSREELASAGSLMRPGEVQLVLSAAYMDFKTGEVKQAAPTPKFVVPTTPPD